MWSGHMMPIIVMWQTYQTLSSGGVAAAGMAVGSYRARTGRGMVRCLGTCSVPPRIAVGKKR